MRASENGELLYLGLGRGATCRAELPLNWRLCPFTDPVPWASFPLHSLEVGASRTDLAQSKLSKRFLSFLEREPGKVLCHLQEPSCKWKTVCAQ